MNRLPVDTASDIREPIPFWQTIINFAPYVVFLCMLYMVFAMTVDDAYITLRYAHNILSGYGAVFNPGERVEGCTSPLHLMLCVALLKVFTSVDPLFKTKLLGIFFGFLTLFLVDKLCRLWKFDILRTLLIQLIIVFNMNFATSAVNGLETTLFSALLIGFLLVQQRESHLRGRVLSGYLLFVCLLTRPETIIIGTIYLIYAYLSVRGDAEQVDRIRRTTMQFALCTVGLFAVRYSYYHSLLPNTYYAKSVPLMQAIKEGVRYLVHPLSPNTLGIQGLFATPHKIAFNFTMAVFWILAAYGAFLGRRDRAIQISAIISGSAILFVLRSGGDWMSGWRFMISALPFVAILQTQALNILFQKFVGRQRFALQFATVTFIWLGSYAISPKYPWSNVNFSSVGSDLLASSGSVDGLGKLQMKLADYIKRKCPPGSTVAYSEMGYVGYMNPDIRLIDVHGLVDADIAHVTGVRRMTIGVYDVFWNEPNSPVGYWLKKKRPDVIISGIANPEPRVLGVYQIRDWIDGAPVYVRDGFNLR